MKKIAIHSVPRSGSTWLGEIFNSSFKTKYCYQPLFSYALKDYLTERSGKAEVQQFFRLCMGIKDEFVCQSEKRAKGILPIFSKVPPLTHVVYKEVRYHNILRNIMDADDDMKLIGLIRNPLAVLSSWFEAPREFHPDWDRAAEWLTGQSKNRERAEEFYGFAKWVEVARLFHDLAERFPDRVMIIKYADLLADPHTVVSSLFDFSDLEVDSQVSEFLSESRKVTNDDTYSVYRGDASDRKWVDSVSQDIVAAVQQLLENDPLRGYLGDLR